MPSTPLICCSSGEATVSAMTVGFAPGYEVLTTTVGGTTFGYSLKGSRKYAIAPITKMMMEMTPAKIGRLMKKLEIFMRILDYSLTFDSRDFTASPTSTDCADVSPSGLAWPVIETFLGVTVDPGRTRCRPL